MRRANDPAFHYGETVGENGRPLQGLTVLEYFAARAPYPPPPWYDITEQRPTHRDMSLMEEPLSPDGRRLFADWRQSDEDYNLGPAAAERCPDDEEELRRLEVEWLAWRQAVHDYDETHYQLRDTTWPFAWARLVLAAGHGAVHLGKQTEPSGADLVPGARYLYHGIPVYLIGFHPHDGATLVCQYVNDEDVPDDAGGEFFICERMHLRPEV